MYCLNKPGGDGHVTIGGGLVTKCMTYILSAVGLGAAFAIAYLWNSKDSHDKVLVAISSTVPWVSVFVLTCLALYSPLEDSPSCLLSAIGSACDCRTKWGPFESKTFFGCWESRVTFYKWMRIYFIWTLISIGFFIVLIVDDVGDGQLWMVRLYVIGVSALCDIVMVFASYAWLKEAFFTVPIIKKIYSNKLSPGNRKLQFDTFFRVTSDLIKEKKTNGLLYHRNFSKVKQGHESGGGEPAWIKIVKSNITVTEKTNELPPSPVKNDANDKLFIVKIGLQDASRQFVPVSGNDNSKRYNYSVHLVELDLDKKVRNVWDGLPVEEIDGGYYQVYDPALVENPEMKRRIKGLAGFHSPPRGENYALQMHVLDVKEKHRARTAWKAVLKALHLNVGVRDESFDTVHRSAENIEIMDSKVQIIVKDGNKKINKINFNKKAIAHHELAEADKKKILKDMKRPVVVRGRAFPIIVKNDEDDKVSRDSLDGVKQKVTENANNINDISLNLDEVVEKVEDNLKRIGTLEEANAEREKMRFIEKVPVPRRVSKGGGVKGTFRNMVKMKFGCYLCDNKGITISSTKVGMYGRLALAGAKGVVAIAGFDAFGILEHFSSLLDSVKEIRSNSNKKDFEKFEALQKGNRRRGGKDHQGKANRRQVLRSLQTAQSGGGYDEARQLQFRVVLYGELQSKEVGGDGECVGNEIFTLRGNNLNQNA